MKDENVSFKELKNKQYEAQWLNTVVGKIVLPEGITGSALFIVKNGCDTRLNYLRVVAYNFMKKFNCEITIKRGDKIIYVTNDDLKNYLHRGKKFSKTITKQTKPETQETGKPIYKKGIYYGKITPFDYKGKKAVVLRLKNDLDMEKILFILQLLLETYCVIRIDCLSEFNLSELDIQLTEHGIKRTGDTFSSVATLRQKNKVPANNNKNNEVPTVHKPAVSKYKYFTPTYCEVPEESKKQEAFIERYISMARKSLMPIKIIYKNNEGEITFSSEVIYPDFISDNNLMKTVINNILAKRKGIYLCNEQRNGIAAIMSGLMTNVKQK